MFSLYLGLLDDESKVWFGGYDRSVIIEQALRDDPDGQYETMSDSELDDLIEWFPLSYKAYWSTPLEKVTLNGVNLNVEVENLIFDSGSSLNHIPVSDFNKVIDAITANRVCDPYMRPLTTYYCDCDSVEDSTFPII